jgi:hypothetical protein
MPGVPGGPHDAEDHRQLIRQAQAEARGGDGPGWRVLPAGQRPRAAEGGALRPVN